MFNWLNNLLVLDGSNVNYLVSFVAGFVTFFASCLLPLIPTYLGYLSGVALNSDEASGKKWEIFKTSLFFVLGFVATFVILGLSLNRASIFLINYRNFLEKLFGLLFIVLGLFMLGVFKHRLFIQERKLKIDKLFTSSKSIHSIIAGVAFAFAWTPCIGPVLAVILYWSAQAETTIKALTLLITYGMGLGLPFLIVGLAFEQVIPWLKRNAKISLYASKIAAVVVLIAGILMLIGSFGGATN